MSWYYVDSGGNTQGPFDIGVMKQRYSSNQLTNESYVWNGTSVNQWTPLKQVAILLNQLKPAPAQPKPAPSSGPARPARKNPFGGGGKGGRANLLAAIQSGKTLKKVEKKVDDTPKVAQSKPAPNVGGIAGLGAALARRRAKVSGGAGGGVKKTYSAPKSSAAAGGVKKKTWGNPKPAGGAKKTWGNSSSSSSSSSYGGGGGGAKLDRIKNALNSAEDWQIKAIERILGL